MLIGFTIVAAPLLFAIVNGAVQMNRLSVRSQELVVHGMQGFDYDRARSELGIPADFQVDAMAAVGKPGDVQQLPENMRAREQPNDRRPIAETVRAGAFSF